ncbi:isocitrate dehydrogenase (NAD+) [Monoraphidium neglectum]|uniref:Isocitrate dehydrogenase (NAD+) n=1 Tax=Monoraphidium neglectum TaxID=145388 RepID=A0A0D2JAS9_9CHLO|nr:isocitrate dehydrogenase (NAD+) [Monoraphidium neglectum]KIY96837.1 isocitrate dehydrogenase (NAD+) [Monoraphidium neglectum]|eukprot:XP_013895857.1 isocitrate dehydrogenase (NAD+) [Monoraphidium neglectum]
MWSQAHVDTEAHFNVAARGAGSYKVCFQSNSRADVLVDLVYFSLGHLRRPGQVNVPKGSQETRGKELASKSHLDEVKRNVMVVGELVEILNGEQRYLQRKLDRHVQTCVSAELVGEGARGPSGSWYTVLEVAVLAAVGCFNVFALSSMFKGPGAARGLLTYMPKPGSGKTKAVTLIPGDGIGPEVTDAVVQIVDALEAPIVWERFDGLSGSLPDGTPRLEVPKDVLDSIRKNGVCLKGTLFTPLSHKNTSTQSLNVQLRKDLDLVVNLVHGFSIPGLKTRHEDLDIVVIRCARSPGITRLSFFGI